MLTRPVRLDFPIQQPGWYTKFNSPYYTQSHVEYRAKVRAFVEKEIMPHTHEWLSLIHISEPTRRTPISYAVFCLK